MPNNAEKGGPMCNATILLHKLYIILLSLVFRS